MAGDVEDIYIYTIYKRSIYVCAGEMSVESVGYSPRAAFEKKKRKIYGKRSYK